MARHSAHQANVRVMHFYIDLPFHVLPLCILLGFMSVLVSELLQWHRIQGQFMHYSKAG